MGMSHGNAHTFPRMADVIGFVEPSRVIEVAKGVLTIHRDFGDRTNRKHARLKYVLEDRGVEWFKQELEKRVGFLIEPARPYQFTKQGDLYGWHKQFDGKYFLGLFVENGRVKDVDGYQLKTGLRKVVEQFKPEIRLTPSQNLLLVNVSEEQRDGINKVLAEHGIPVENQASIIRRASIACPALPTCGLSLAESERAIPDVLARIEKLLVEVGIPNEEVIVRMTGCPNGCARPYAAEIGFVGRAPGKYALFLGGNEGSTRLNWVYRESVKNEEIVNELRPLFTRFVQQRTAGERFGDFCERVIKPEVEALKAHSPKAIGL
jgi:sulfite reductase (NADPH) hemoprotein beta-component